MILIQMLRGRKAFITDLRGGKALSKSMRDTICSKITCAVEREHQSRAVDTISPTDYMSSCHFISFSGSPLGSAMEVPSARCGSNCSAQLVTGDKSDFLEIKRETDTKNSN